MSKTRRRATPVGPCTMVRLQRVARGEKGEFIAVGVTEEDGYPAGACTRPLLSST